MERKKSSIGIQKKILLITLSFILGMCIIITTASNYIFQKYLRNSLIQSTEINLQFLSDNINKSIEGIQKMARFCQTNTNIAAYIEGNPDPSAVLSISTHDRLTEEFNNNTSQNYMPRVVVICGDNYLQVVSAPFSTTTDIAEAAPTLPYFDLLLNDSSYNYSIGLVDDPFAMWKPKPVLMIIRPITYRYNSVQGGYVLIEVSSDLFTVPLSNYNVAEDSCLFLTLADHTYLFADGILTESDFPAENSDNIIVTTPLSMPDCSISQMISPSELTNQQLIYRLVLFGSMIAVIIVGIALMMILNSTIHVPVKKIRERMDHISAGDFSRDTSIEWDHELGDIGRGINNLSENVLHLLDKRLEDEKQKRDLEYQMLQSQINPHFLYNTLNSIKWMATAQNATGIAEMTLALSRLLKSVSKGTTLLVSLREELDLLNNYFTIQQYRYGGTISLTVQIDSPELFDCSIVKFTLQPLVENAIFHGIEPKGCSGNITIHAAFCGTDEFTVTITDDGVGMSAETITKVLNTHQETSSTFFKEIGLYNVHKRIQYQYGEKYGISITSAEGEYTAMTIYLPVTKGGPADV